MNIQNIGNIPNITIQITTGTPQAGFRCDPSAAATSGSGTSQGSARLLHLDLSDRKGYREDYSIRDAAEGLWKKENFDFNIFDPASIQRMQDRVRQGSYTMKPTDAELSAYMDTLRQNGLDGSVDWSGLTRELEAFKTTTPEELEDGLDYLASRYVAALDKLERNYTGEELTAQLAKLEEVYQAGKSGMIDGYTQALQDNLGLSDSDAQAVRDSFSTILAEKGEAYRGALKQVHEAVAQTGPDSVWLKDHDAYIASQLRTAGKAGKAGQSEARYSVQDLAAAGKIAQDYQAEIFGASSCGRDEARLGLNLAMADMKAETMISKGLVSENMASLLRNSRAQGHENALAALDQALARRESNRSSGEPKGTFAPVDRSVFQGIYNATMNAYRQNGGDGAGAIRAGVSAGQKLTAQAAARNPQALRWGISQEHYWKEFYKTPEERTPSRLDTQINNLLIQAGQPPRPQRSTYQEYVNRWQDFLTAIGGGVNIRA
ncbi:hypothetical protein [Flintibacter muris]|uniref:hypothetical protein n=1 Tax=Flintibacter muris TaxID=2941327 RepID=UPI0020417010|nr:hypothetical protein [Flintibacter muris]